MKYVLKITLVFSFCATFLCNNSIAQQDIAISGTVRSRINNLPLGNVIVEVKGNPDKLVITNIDGKFISSFRTNLPVTLKFSKTGYESKEIIIEQEFSYGIEIILNEKQQGIIISGRVFSSDTRQPLPGAIVEFSNSDRSITTNEKGEFILTSDDPPIQDLLISKTGYETRKFVIKDYFLFDKEIVLVLLESETDIMDSEESKVDIVGSVENGFRIKGSVFSEYDEPLTGVNIIIENRFEGTSTDGEGKFELGTRLTPPQNVLFSMMGYETQHLQITSSAIYEVKIVMREKSIMGEEIIITAPVVEVEEKLLNVPISIERMDILTVRETPAVNFYNAIANLKGVDVTTQSKQFQTVNARAFNSTENVRFVQLVDGMDNQAPGLNFPIGNIAGVSEIDLEMLDFLPGPASALYGPNALNGILIMKSKDPFKFQGFSAYVKPGVSDIVVGSDYPFQFIGYSMVDGAIRYAKAFNDKFAFKINASYMGGEDWHAHDTSNLTRKLYVFETDPGYNGLNVYGDEISEDLPIGPDGSLVTITRTGYYEKDLVDYEVENIKLNGALHYRINDNITAILQGNYGYATTVYTGDNRMSLSGFKLFQGKAEVKGKRFFVRGYSTSQNSGNSYDSRYLAININRFWKSDDKWFRDYKNAYSGALISYGVIGGDHDRARAFADGRQRILAGTPEFNAIKDSLINLTGYSGARILNNSSLYHIEGQVDSLSVYGLVFYSGGLNYRMYDLNSNGTIFPDTTGNDITVMEYGGFLQGETKLLDQRLNLIASIRYDKNENFEGQITPRLSMGMAMANEHFLRASLQTGFRNPTGKEQFIDQNLGFARLLGGLGYVSDKYDLVGNAFFLQDVQRFNREVAEDVYDYNYGQDQAIIKNLPLLEKGLVTESQYGNLEPEKVRSFELGYKKLFENKFFVDASYYRSTYRDFIGFIRMIKTSSSPESDLFSAAQQVNNSTQSEIIYMYSNSQKKVNIQGITLGLKYLFPVGAILSLNGTWSKLDTHADDPIIPGFNTPKYKVNLSLSNRQMDNLENNPGFRNVGFNFVWRWQSTIDWESPFADGTIPGISTIDMQFSVKIQGLKSIVKAGVSNFLNTIYTNSFGGPQVGSIYYISLTFDEMFNW